MYEIKWDFDQTYSKDKGFPWVVLSNGKMISASTSLLLALKGAPANVKVDPVSTELFIRDIHRTANLRPAVPVEPTDGE